MEMMALVGAHKHNLEFQADNLKHTLGHLEFTQQKAANNAERLKDLTKHLMRNIEM
jgi:hypothetical protein